MNKSYFWIWSLFFAVCLGFGIWSLGFWLGGCGHPINQSEVGGPVVVSVSPADKSTGIDPGTAIRATFDLALDPSTVNASNFSLSSQSGSVAGTATYNAANKQLVFTHGSLLALSTVYTAVVSDNVKSFDGVKMSTPFSWSFTTGSYEAAVGTPDASFTDGSNIGFVLDSRTGAGEQVKIDKDGKIVVCGYAQDSIALWRYLPDGTPDPRFGNNGMVTGDAGFATSFDFDPQGNIIVATPYGSGGSILLKFDTLGNRDTSFVNQAITNATSPMPRSVIIDSAGNIYVAGYGHDVNNLSKENGYVWKFKSDGSLDPNFGSGGAGFIQTNKDTDLAGDAEKILFDASGKLVVAGSSVWRFNPDTGAPDPSFVTNGLVDGSWQSAAIDTAGNIYVTGVSGISKLDEWGTLKAKALFLAGSSTYSFPIGQKFFDIAVDASGKILVAGEIGNSGSGYFMAIWRCDAALILDPSFGIGGAAQQIKTDDEQAANSLVIDSIGKIVATGKFPTTIVLFSNNHMAIWKFK